MRSSWCMQATCAVSVETQQTIAYTSLFTKSRCKTSPFRRNPASVQPEFPWNPRCDELMEGILRSTLQNPGQAKANPELLERRSSRAMSLGRSQIRATFRRLKAHFLMTLAQLGYTILYFITEASFNQGLNPYVYITYRHFAGGLVMWPFAYFLERKIRPKLTWALFLEICVLSLLGVSLTLNMYFASLRYTSPVFVSSMVNTIASMTFVIAILLRLEHLDVKSPHGVAKIVGTIVSLAGVTTMTLYKGPAVRNFWGALIRMQGNTIHENWLKGSILTVASCITWSIWYIMQAMTLKRYPAQLSLTTWMSLIGGIQSAVFTASVEHKPTAWMIGSGIDLWSILYSGVICSGLIIFIQLWCTEEKGPVFVTMFNPLSTIMVALLAYFVFGERLYTGSIIGGVIVIIGLYLVLWGKERDQEQHMRSNNPSYLASGKDEASQYENDGKGNGIERSQKV